LDSLYNEEVNPKILAILAAITLPISYLFDGAILMTLWRWFVTPLGLAEISIWWAIGLVAIINYFKGHDSVDAETITYGVFIKGLLKAIMSALLYLLVGFLVHLAM